MTADTRWPRVRALFEEALDLAPQERTGFLRRLEDADADLRPEIEKLLAAESRIDGFLDSPFGSEVEPSLVGRQVGGFRVVGPIASGGMGRVWEAEQDDPHRKVALKTMRAGLASRQGRRRFRFEAEALAGLRHPAIAQVYGAGVLEGEGLSLPWFALEFVEGARTLPRYAEEEGLDLASRLRLFQQVCRAVQHAHQRGVIHRDLKAGNLLVDRDGHVKVIDFGVARLLDRGTGDEYPGDTLAGEIVGTLESMSPEQIEGRREEVDARTDVYALGVVLYELTTGQGPYELSGLALPAAARQICEVEPAPPSRVAVGIPREVDWIVTTAMAKDPARRYAAAVELEHDLERLLSREPVLAGPPSKTYRLRKFYERHRLGVASLGIALLAIFAGLFGTIFGLLRDQRAQSAEQAAEIDAAMTERLSTFLADLFERTSPEQAEGREPSARNILERGTEWIRSEAGGRPLVQARLLRTAGQVLSSRGAYDEAREALEEAVELARDEGGTDELELVRGLLGLGQLYRRTDEDVRAGECLREALAIQERVLGEDHVGLSAVLNELGLLLRVADPEEAERLYLRSYELLVREHGEGHGDAAVVLGNIGSIQARTRRYEAARETLERVLPILVEHHGENDPRTAKLFGNLSVVHLNLGNYERADELQRRDLEISTRVLTADHPELATILMNQGRISERLGEPQRALDELARALEIAELHYPPSHPLVLAVQRDSARVLVGAGRYEEARDEAESALGQEPTSVEGRVSRLGSLAVLAEIERLEGQPEAALALTDELLADPLCAGLGMLESDARWERAYAFIQLGDRAAADDERRRALELLPAGRHDNPFGDAKFLALTGDHERALQVLAQEVRAGYRNRLVLTDPDLAVLRELPGFAPISAALARNTDE